MTDGTYCAVCNTVLSSQTQIPVVNHTYDNAQDESCNECNFIRVLNCSHTKTVKLAAVSPTCTNDGKTEGTHCAVCQIVLVYQQSIPAFGHSFDPLNALTPCSVCGAPAPHTHSYTEQNTADEYQKEAANCLSPAVYYYSCICGEKGSKTFSYGNIGNCVIVTEPGYPATCDTPGLTESTYCSVCQTVNTIHKEIRELGHTFATENSLPTCLVCGDKGTVIVQDPDNMFFQDNTFRIDRITYTIRRDTVEEKWEIMVYVQCTNLTSSLALMLPDFSMHFYDANGRWSAERGFNYAGYVEPYESGTCGASFRVPNSSDIYKLVIS